MAAGFSLEMKRGFFFYPPQKQNEELVVDFAEGNFRFFFVRV